MSFLDRWGIDRLPWSFPQSIRCWILVDMKGIPSKPLCLTPFLTLKIRRAEAVSWFPRSPFFFFFFLFFLFFFKIAVCERFQPHLKKLFPLPLTPFYFRITCTFFCQLPLFFSYETLIWKFCPFFKSNSFHISPFFGWSNYLIFVPPAFPCIFFFFPPYVRPSFPHSPTHLTYSSPPLPFIPFQVILR